MKRAYIKEIAYYVPEKILDNKYFESILDTNNEWIITRTGIETRRMAREDETIFEMGINAVNNLQNKGVDLTVVDTIITPTVTKDYIFPSMAGQIQKALGLKNCFAFDMSAACSGYVYAMNTATALIESGQSKNILIVCSEKLTKDINWKDRKNSKKNETEEFNDQIEGRNAVLELLESGKDINKIYITKGEKHGSITKIIAKARERKIVTVEVEREKINQMAQTENAQGVIAIVPPFDYCEVEDILNEAKSKKEKAFILILDGIEDPHNLGSIIRTAETAGVHGIIIPKRRAAAVNSTVVKTSAGATSFMKVARVNNINETIKYLKENDVWIYGTDMETDKMYYDEDLTGNIAIVIGSEGFGMSKLVKENCDFLIKIPMKGKITSLNASVSAGIVMYEAVKQRIK